jgi:hypothetical protein
MGQRQRAFTQSATLIDRYSNAGLDQPQHPALVLKNVR